MRSSRNLYREVFRLKRRRREGKEGRGKEGRN